jgi:hypothetical protein
VHGGYTHTADSGSSKRIYQDAVEVLLKCDADRAEGELSYFNDDCTLNNNNPRAKSPGKYLALNQSIDCTPGGGPLLPMQLVGESYFWKFEGKQLCDMFGLKSTSSLFASKDRQNCVFSK